MVRRRLRLTSSADRRTALRSTDAEVGVGARRPPAQVADHDVERPLQRLDLARQQQLRVEVGAGPGGGAERAPEGAVGGDRQLGEELRRDRRRGRSPARAPDRGPRSAGRCGGRRRRRASGAARTAAAARRRPRRSSVDATRTVTPMSTSRGMASTTRAKFSGPRIASFSIGSAESSEIWISAALGERRGCAAAGAR